MTGGFCYHAYSSVGETGYYVQGCTAGNVDDPNCLSRCGKFKVKAASAEHGLIVIDLPS